MFFYQIIQETKIIPLSNNFKADYQFSLKFVVYSQN